MEIFSVNHVFSGDCTLENGMYRVVLSENTISIYYWNGSQYVKIDDFIAGTFSRVTLLELTQDLVKCKTDNVVEISLERGRVSMIYSPEDLMCNSLTPVDQSTADDKYLRPEENLHVCSDSYFSIASGVIDAGRLWIFQEDVNPQSIAHGVLVISNLKKEVVVR